MSARSSEMYKRSGSRSSKTNRRSSGRSTEKSSRRSPKRPSSKRLDRMIRVGGTDSNPSLIEMYDNDDQTGAPSVFSNSTSSSTCSDEGRRRERLTVQNACMRLVDKKIDRPKVRNRILRFIYANLHDVVNEPTWRLLVEPNYMLELFQCSANITDPVEETGLEDGNQSPIEQGVLLLWQDSVGLTRPSAHSDLIIQTKDGKSFYVHRQIMCLVSPSFVQWLNDECDHNGQERVFIEKIDGAVVEEFLKALYQQKPSKAFSELVDLIYVMACDYHVDHLLTSCEREMASQQLTSVQAALELLRDAEEHRMTTAKSMCFRYLYKKAHLLNSNEEWETLVHDEPELLAEMIIESKQFRRINPCT